ncbi:uncharacterized protein DNG_07736 [Cephalotrichum gorgonifer]|uniref:Uncharacterized protein n=1 Tax=Cephalotrichum gorgonifer TaxID=2041049 RepID=A0AAE8N269_9PEZI|nr:uncharacterized protein DNG_07736 [Cephalotrichum gorgonifer]
MDWNDSTQVAGRLSANDAAKAAASLNQDKTSTSTRQTASTTISRTTGMLPTPAKTPKKAPAEKNPAIQSIARNLFASDEEIMPSPRKARAKKYTGISLDSFRAEEDPIEIFTDSKERVPEKEVSADNPFYGEQVHTNPAPGGQESGLRRSKRRHVHVPGEGRQTVEEAMQREDGLVYVFRGKKVFRKFAETGGLDGEDDGAEDGGESPVHGRMTRSSIKPRLLFPSKPRSEAAIQEEEADTDIDDDANTRSAERTDGPQTPTVESKVSTPNAPGYSPVSPPDTRRTTRTRDRKLDEGTPIKPKGRTSPFDSWPRVKSRSDSGVSTKRAGSSLTSATAKKARS